MQTTVTTANELCYEYELTGEDGSTIRFSLSGESAIEHLSKLKLDEPIAMFDVRLLQRVGLLDTGRPNRYLIGISTTKIVQ